LPGEEQETAVVSAPTLVLSATVPGTASALPHVPLSSDATHA
jgi:hypothetical protein